MIYKIVSKKIQHFVENNCTRVEKNSTFADRKTKRKYINKTKRK